MTSKPSRRNEIFVGTLKNLSTRGSIFTTPSSFFPPLLSPDARLVAFILCHQPTLPASRLAKFLCLDKPQLVWKSSPTWMGGQLIFPQFRPSVQTRSGPCTTSHDGPIVKVKVSGRGENFANGSLTVRAGCDLPDLESRYPEGSTWSLGWINLNFWLFFWRGTAAGTVYNIRNYKFCAVGRVSERDLATLDDPWTRYKQKMKK